MKPRLQALQRRLTSRNASLSSKLNSQNQIKTHSWAQPNTSLFEDAGDWSSETLAWSRRACIRLKFASSIKHCMYTNPHSIQIRNAFLDAFYGKTVHVVCFGFKWKCCNKNRKKYPVCCLHKLSKCVHNTIKFHTLAFYCTQWSADSKIQTSFTKTRTVDHHK